MRSRALLVALLLVLVLGASQKTSTATPRAATTPIAVSVNPAVLMAGGTVILKCRVPADVDNRRIGFGLLDYSESERDVEGDRSPVTFMTTIQHVPCGVTTAYCAVAKVTGKVERATTRIEVGGCN